MKSSSPSVSLSSSSSGGSTGKKGCCSKVGLKRGPWTAEEDRLLSAYIQREGEGRWRTLPKKAGLLRCGKSCRLRWMNYLRPSLKRGHISPDEEDLILRLHRLLGNRWSLIAGRIPGRTDNEIKNYWNTHLSKKLINQGIDPKTHKPLSNPNDVNYYHPSTVDTKNVLNSSSSVATHSSVPCSASNVPFATGNFNYNVQLGVGEGNVDNYAPRLNNNDRLWEVGNRTEEASGMISNEDGGEGDVMMINCCSQDDAFSSFFNSLINDDMFSNQQQQDEHEQHDQCSSSLI